MVTVDAKLADAKRRMAKSYWSERILAELEYACNISRLDEGKYDNLIGQAIDFLAERYDSEGAVTKESALKAEEMIKDIASDAKRFKIICAAHAHIDMNWMWRWDETVSITLDTFRTMLDLMEEYPDFKFSQSQASVYRIVEEYDRDMLEEIRQRVKEGRWEVTASTWVEADKNIPSGESHARHILYTKKYLSKLLDIKPESLNLDFEPDTFGHNANVPEILSRGGIKYYYHCRGYDGHNLYRWKAPSGASVLVYREPIWYNASIEPSMAFYVPEFCSKHNIDTMLKVYGVGDHGGGPTRRDIERIIDMNTWPVFPEIGFGTFKEFFSLMDNSSAGFPEVDSELNFVFSGCYTTQTRIKMANRTAEETLNEAELFNSVSQLCEAYKYSPEAFAKAWENVLFNHFHDIIPGSCTIDTREYAMGLFQKTMAIANSRKTAALRGIASMIDTSSLVPEQDISQTTSEGAGVGFRIKDFKIAQVGRGAGKTRIFNVFNSAPFACSEAAEITVWDWEGHLDRIVFKNERGEIAEHQLLGDGIDGYWGHNYFRALVKVEVPACGYSTYTLSESDDYRICNKYPIQPRVEKPYEYIMENKYIKAEFDTRNAAIISLVDKENGEELVNPQNPAGIFRYIEEDTQMGMTAWIVGRYMNIVPLLDNVKITDFQSGKDLIRQSLSYEIKFKSSKLTVTVSLDYNSPRLSYDVECDWHETGRPGEFIPQLGFFVPVNYDCISYKYDVPFGVIERKGMDMDVPGNSWVAGVRSEKSKKSVMLVTSSKHGFRSLNNSLSVTLIRGAYDPDPYPELGIHKFGFSINLISAANNKDLIECGYRYNHSLNVISVKAHKGTLPLSKSFIELLGGSAVISAVKMPEDFRKTEDNPSGRKIIVRVYEVEGFKTQTLLRLPQNIRKAYYVDFNENPVSSDSDISIEGDKIAFEVGANSIASICVEL